MKKKVLLLFIVFDMISLFISCRNPEPEPPWAFFYGYNAFDSTNCVPMNYTLEVINNTDEASSFFVLPILVPANAYKQCVVLLGPSEVDEAEKQFSGSIMSDGHVVGMAVRKSSTPSYESWQQAINDDTIYYGISTIVLYEKTQDSWKILWDGAGGEMDKFIRCCLEEPHVSSDDVFELEECLPDVGGDFYYYLDPEKSGTESFGRLYSTVSELNGMESGNIKIQLIIDKDSDGKKTVSFAYVGVVED